MPCPGQPAPFAGTVSAVGVAVGDQVGLGQVLFVVDEVLSDEEDEMLSEEEGVA